MPDFKLRRYGPKKNFYVFWTEDGRSERRSTGTPNLVEAKVFRDELVRDLLTPKDAKPSEVTIATVLNRYQDEKGIGSPSEKANDMAIRGFFAFYGEDLLVSELTPSNHIAYEKHCRTKFKHKPSTINKRRNVLIAALNHAKKNHVLNSLPHVPAPSTPPRKERYLTRDEAAWMIREARRTGASHIVLFIRLGLYTAARATAILQLTWDRVDLATGRIDFRLPGEVETKKRRPHAPINSMLVRALRAERKKNKGKHVIAYHGRQISLIRKGFLKIAKKVGLKGVSPHTLKHTAITWMLQNKVQPWQVSGLTAASVTTLLRVYGHHVQDDLREAVNMRRTRNGRATQPVL